MWPICFFGGPMPESAPRKTVLICESYPGLRDAFELMLGKHYELLFLGNPTQITSLLEQRAVSLVIWHLDGSDEPNLRILQKWGAPWSLDRF